jgi:hypothetical protein
LGHAQKKWYDFLINTFDVERQVHLQWPHRWCKG